MGTVADEFEPFVVFGASKSGTTWLQQLIDAHPQCRCHFQTPIFPFQQDPTWRTLVRRYPTVHNRGGSPFGGLFEDAQAEQEYQWRMRFLRAQSFLTRDYARQHSDSVVEGEYLEEYFRPIVQAAVRTILVDDHGLSQRYGTKSYTDIEQLLDVFPRSKIITIVRDGRDVVVSKRFHTLRMGTHFHGDERWWWHRALNRWVPLRRILNKASRTLNLFSAGAFRDPREGGPLLTPEVIKKYAIQWRETVGYLQGWQDHLGMQMLTIRYESLYEDPTSTLAEVYRFLGVGDSADLVLDAVTRTEKKPNSKAEGESFFRKGGSGGWTEHFAARDLRLFNEIAGEQMEALGFSTREPNLL